MQIARCLFAFIQVFRYCRFVLSHSLCIRCCIPSQICAKLSISWTLQVLLFVAFDPYINTWRLPGWIFSISCMLPLLSLRQTQLQEGKHWGNNKHVILFSFSNLTLSSWLVVLSLWWISGTFDTHILRPDSPLELLSRYHTQTATQAACALRQLPFLIFVFRHVGLLRATELWGLVWCHFCTHTLYLKK